MYAGQLHRAWPVVLAVCLTAVGGGCATGAPPSTLMRDVGDSEMSPEELRIRVRALAPRFSGQLEAMADEVSARAASLETRLAMARFKENAIPAMQAALFHRDPVAALVDAWALLAQLKDAVDNRLPEPQPDASFIRSRFRSMEREVEGVWRELTGSEDVSATRRRIHGWAAKHPITETVAARASTAGLLARLTARPELRNLRTLGVLVEDTADLAARLDVQTAWLPKQVRWQTERLLLELLTDPSFEGELDEVQTLVTALERTSRLARDLPQLIEREREAAVAALDQERLAVQTYVTGEREALLADLRAEREAILSDLEGERTAAMADAQAIGDRWIARTFDRVEAVLGRAFVGLLALGALLLVGQAAVVLLFLSRRGRRTARSEGWRPGALGVRRRGAEA